MANAVKGRFDLVGGHVALDFANTLDYRFAPERRRDLLSGYADLLEFVVQSGVMTSRQAGSQLRQVRVPVARRALHRAIRLREAIDSVFRSVIAGRRPRRSDLSVLNDHLMTRRSSETLAWQGSGLVRTYVVRADDRNGPLGIIADAAARLLASSDCESVRECADPSCRWLFLDRTKNHSRRWCAMGLCGSRSKVRRFRSRQAAVRGVHRRRSTASLT